MTVATQASDAALGASSNHLPLEELVAHGDVVTQEIAAALAALDGSLGLELGPAEAQDDPADLVPEQGLHGVMISMSIGPVAQVVVIVDDQLHTTFAGPSEEDPAVPSGWLAAASAAVQQWAISIGGVVGGAVEVQRAPELDHLLAVDSDLVLVAAGMFDGGRHAGTVAVLGRAQAAEGAADGAGSDGVGAVGGDQPPAPVESAAAAALRALADVEMTVTAELGRTRMNVSALLELGPGSVIELDRTAGSPIDLLVNGTLIARGEVVVIDEEYGIRLTEIVGSGEG